MSVHFNEGNGLEDLKECVGNVNGGMKNIIAIYGKENEVVKKIWGVEQDEIDTDVFVLTSGLELYYSKNPSADTWIKSSFPAKITNWCLTYGNGKFVGFEFPNGEPYASVIYSKNGRNWTRIQTDYSTLNSAPNNIFFAGNKFFINEQLKNTIIYSDNLRSWNKITTPTIVYSITYCFGKYIICGDGGVYSSENLTTWTPLNNTIGGGYFYEDLIFENNTLLLKHISSSGIKIQYSTDGINLTLSTGLPTDSNDYCLTYGNNVFSMIPTSSVLANTKYCYYSVNNGQSFIKAPSNLPPDTASHYSSRPVYGNGLFLYKKGIVFMKSTDGISWSQAYTNSSVGNSIKIIYSDND